MPKGRGLGGVVQQIKKGASGSDMREIENVKEQQTFIIRILNRQNATWQGVVTRTDKQEEKPFRSLLELIKLVNSALAEEEGGDPPARDVG
jgi:hypothetical protein